MSLSIKLLECNGLCRSCYEARIRKVSPVGPYDINAILKTIDIEAAKIPAEERRKYNPPCVHGGEPLLIPIIDLEKILASLCQYWGRTSMQTNGTILTDRHIDLFRKYRTSIGVSIDGDTAELNYGRWNGNGLTGEQVQKMTDRTLDNMRRIKAAGISLSVIVLLRKYNAVAEKLPELERFLFRLKNEFGIYSLRTNEVIVFDSEYMDEEELTPRELGEAFCRLADISFDDPDLDWRPYSDIIKLFSGDNSVTCVFQECDPWRTEAERTVNHHGAIGGCLKTGAGPDGIQALAAECSGGERYHLLPNILQSLGGCKGCDYWPICKGGCPGAAIDNDWRNRTRFCEAWKMLFNHVLHRRLARFIIDQAYRRDAESQGSRHADVPHGDQHGDHTDRRGR
jgi:uncharacterized protein